MLKLYYAKGSSALAAHMLLVELEAAHETVEVSIPKGEHLTPEFLARNPKGRVPVLETPQGIITENPAILEYIAAEHPAANLIPEMPYDQARAHALSAYLCATAHVAFAHKQRGLRWAQQDASIKDMQGLVARNLKECAAFLEADLPLDPWAMGATYRYCDPYLFLLGRWLGAADVSMDAYPKLTAHHRAIKTRPATQRVLQIHGIS